MKYHVIIHTKNRHDYDSMSDDNPFEAASEAIKLFRGKFGDVAADEMIYALNVFSEDGSECIIRLERGDDNGSH